MLLFLLKPAWLSVSVLCCPIAGRMAAAWLFLLTFSLNLLVVGGFRLPAISFLIQEGPPGKEVGSHKPAGNEGPALAAPQKWEWKAAGEGDLGRPLASRRRRDGGTVSKDSTNELPKKSLPVKAEDKVSLGLTSEGKMAKPAPNVTAATASRGKVSQDVAASASNGVSHSKTPKQAAPSPARKSGPNVGEPSAITKGAQDGGRHFVSKGSPVATLNSSEAVLPGRENASVSLREAGDVSTTTEHWPWLHDVTSDAPQTLTEGERVVTSAPWQEGKKKRKGDFRKAVPSPTTDGSWMHYLSTASALTWVDNLDLSTATREEERDTRQPLPRAKGRSVDSPKTVSTGWPWLEEISTPSSQTLMEDYDASTVTPGQILGTEKTGRKGKGMDGSRLRPATAGGPTAATSSTTALVKPPPAVSPRGPPDLLGKCLLAILLLALVAAIFIVITTVLAIILWRQKRASKRNGQNHTEMVCISSLLAAEEAEEAKQRQPKVKRLKMLGDSNGLETEMDNLTLNSFLPEH
ncbi:P-selectin glycoprotein ligand 1 [Pogona vitticeps]